MAKKKNQNQEAAPDAMSKKKNPNQEAAPNSMSEQISSLKALNNLLLRETVERRDQIDTLQRSNESLESKIALVVANYQMLEQEKSLWEDSLLAADIEREISILIVSSQLGGSEMHSEMTQKLKSMEEEREGLIARIAELEEIKLREMQEEANRLICEMGRIQKDLDVKKEEADGLRLKVDELWVSNEEAREEMGLLRMECNLIKKEKMEIEGRFESMRENRDLLQRTLNESTERYEDLERDMRDAVNQRNEMERARNEMGVEIARLQKEVDRLTAELCSNRGSLDRVIQERDEVQNDLDLQKEEGERTIESLMAEKASIERRLMESSQLVDDLKRKMEEMARERNEIEQAKAEKEAAISELSNEVGNLSATISTLQESCGDLTKTNNQLLHDLNHQKNLLDSVNGERDAARQQVARLEEEENRMRLKVYELENNNGEVREELKRAVAELDGLMEERRGMEGLLESSIEAEKALLARLDFVMGKNREIIEEKDEIEQKRIEQEGQIKQLQEEDAVSADLVQQRQETEGLRAKIREMEKVHEEKQQELAQLKTEKDHLVEEIKERERSFELMMKAKTSTESSLVESKERLKDLQIKIELAEMVSQRALLMLKHAAETMNGSKIEENGSNENDVIDSEEMSNEIQPFAKELEAIKCTYRSRLHEVEDMKQELKSLQTSVTESRKTSFWTWLFSATTILSAVSVAFVARGR
ncbi:hypothetical protein MRB53_028116 [Persea americana]|uniref:Uncharacterized protein n=1 Tax=Persea americana TaxID=3435 RepID=A0ACC2KEM1_PERAE|nr:hypothetical protein MRB53_028116 [Persea americana]